MFDVIQHACPYLSSYRRNFFGTLTKTSDCGVVFLMIDELNLQASRVLVHSLSTGIVLCQLIQIVHRYRELVSMYSDGAEY